MRLASSLACCTLLVVACSFDWDSLDPRGATTTSGTGGAGGTTTASSSSSSTTTSSSSSTGGGGASTGGGGAGGDGAGGGTGGQGPVTVSYAADVAECIHIETMLGTGGANVGQVHDPDICAAVVGSGNEIGVDILEDSNGLETRSYLRFDLDTQLAGLTISDVELRLTTNDNGPQSGEAWAVVAFTKNDLLGGPPMRLGATPLAPSSGPYVPGETVSWSLPVSSVSPGATLAIELAPIVNGTNTNGLDYFNNLGTTPPELRVTAQ